MDLISIVSPVYMGEKSIKPMVEEINATFKDGTINYEIILVDDRSPDNSWKIIQQQAKKHSKLKAIRLSRNFGQHIAITAGIEHASGDYIVVMDCDLQVSPSNILSFYQKAKEGHEIIYSHTRKRKHSFFKNLGAWTFYKIFNFLSGRKNRYGDYAINTFTMISRKAATSYLKLTDINRHFLLSLQWLGFESTSMIVTHQTSLTGSSTYTLPKLAKHALMGIITHSSRLLWISILSGIAYVAFSFTLLFYLLINYFMHGYKSGWFSTIFVIMFSVGVLLIFIGVACLYIENIFLQVKRHPLYIKDELIGISE